MPTVPVAVASLHAREGRSPHAVLHPVGCDDGHYAIKVCAGADKFFVMPARSAPGRLKASNFAGAALDDLVYETSPGEFVTITAGDMLSPAVDTRTDDYPTSSPNRALVAHALRSTGILGEVVLVSGLPVDRFYKDGVRNQGLIEAKRESLLRSVTSVGGAQLPKVTRHKVISEAVAAFYDKLLDYEGHEDAEFAEISDESPVVVVDAGGKTLDLATVKEGGAGLYQELSGTADVGALFLYDAIDARLREKFSIIERIPHISLARAIERGTFRVYGERHDVSNIVGEELDRFADRVGFEVRKLVGDASRFGKVLFVGGGANLLRERLDRVFPGVPAHAVSLAPATDNPAIDAGFANARGMYKAAVLDVMNN